VETKQDGKVKKHLQRMVFTELTFLSFT